MVGVRESAGTAGFRSVVVTVGWFVAAMPVIAWGFVPLPDDTKVAVAPRVRINAYPFSLEDVRLLDGPFKKAMERDASYLLTLEPDRLLHRFRLTAGLQPRAPLYGGWETMGISGHSLGHYLSACSMMYASTGDERFHEKVTYIVDELEACQVANGNGYVGGIPDGKRVFAEVAAGDIRSQGFDLNGLWVPWYTQHKLFAGLLDAYRYCRNDKALAVARKLGDWVEDVIGKLNEEQMQKMLACEHGGMNEVLAELYATTGDEKYLALSRRFHHKAVLDPLANRQDNLPGLHANTQIPKIIGVARRYEVTGDAADRTIAEFFWDRVVHHHSYLIGGNSDHEHFGPADKLNDRLSSETCETCNTYNMLKLTRHLFAWRGTTKYADYYERALYNHILASQDPNSGMMCYFVPLRLGEFKRYSNPFNNFTCCHGTGMENHAKYGDSIYFRDDAGLTVSLFIPSELNWKAKGLKVRQETNLPIEDTTTLTLSCDKPVKLAIRIRCPAWATRALEVKVNGKVQAVDAAPGRYAVMAETWKDGDKIEVRIPMGIRLEPMPDNPKRAAILYGPIVVAGDLGPIEKKASNSAVVDDYDLTVLVTGDKPFQDWLVRMEDRPLGFETYNVGRPHDVELIPFYEMHHRRYGVYWDFLTVEQWEKRYYDFLAELKRLRELKARTIDELRIGEMQPERDHNVTGDKTGAGEFNGRKFRHATDGGWFSFEMAVLPSEPVDLLCTFWGSERGPRTFDVLVEGQKIATQSLRDDRPDQFFDIAYPIPVELTRGKQKVTVKLQAHRGNFAGGLFGCRTVRREPKPAPVTSANSNAGASQGQRQVIVPAGEAGKEVPAEVMQRIYDEVKTPHKHGVILASENGAKLDCPCVFRHGDAWYMTYIIFAGTGYETALARSTDLFHWTPLGKVMQFREVTWDARQAAGFVALQDHHWGGSCALQPYEDKYWFSYLGGAMEGYETDPLSVGIAWTSDPTQPVEWTRLAEPVLSRDQPDVREFETVTLYRSNIIHDPSRMLSYPFVMFYNGKRAGGHESIGMAVSKDMRQWLRFGEDPVIDNGKGISGDPQITRVGDVWVMHYFGAFWKPKAFDTFACSYDLAHWTKWTGPHLIEPSEPWDETFAHKPWVIKHDDIVYHFYCAVGNRGRVIALATSKPV
ncbi:MAG: glycoside hydrolase family 127 protein [Sedimentisphaerales bacterium]|nr:glycoside hydrolase family 127 protein [Sedimentisphaerales bacterium]